MKLKEARKLSNDLRSEKIISLYLPSVCEAAVILDDRITELEAWVNDLQSGMYINCVYCGHRYGPRKNTPVAMADILKQHIEKCPHHPLSHMKKQVTELKAKVKTLTQTIRRKEANLNAIEHLNRGKEE